MNTERKHDGQVNLRAVLGLGTLPATADAIMLHAANQINAMRQERIQREKNMAEMRETLEYVESRLLKMYGYSREVNLEVDRLHKMIHQVVAKTKGE